ncbi:hypothetical protein RchiOBHm_Chr4g0411111 [Rosa chinensis]|uniref:Uncharacterized protein n=1 Tax=Rosa chinensis TaxID=74649 RepID=A0A2P6QVI0_ROSCH|nr:hypothetical protein RchiOBHm_Chr4g0411111 [Rosa chinensis]
MVSKNATPPVGLYLDPNEMALPGLGPFASVTTAATTTVSTTSSAEDLSKKIRKPHTITKSRESWTEPEHALAVIGIRLKLLSSRRQLYRSCLILRSYSRHC